MSVAALRALQPSLLAPVKPGEMGGLFSYHYFKDTDLGRFLGSLEANGYRPEVFTDSGGFSAFSQGVTVDLEDYVRWLLRWRHLLHHYANLDVIGDPRASLRNLLKMESRGLRPLPVTHVGTSPEEIRRYKARGYVRQCLGGLVPHLTAVSTAIRQGSPHDVVKWIADCHVVAEEEGVILHGFGATNLNVVRAYRWVSTDSSSWAAGFRFGNVEVFDPISGRLMRFQLRDTRAIMALADVIRWYGVDPLSLVRDGDQIRISMLTLTARSYLVISRWLRERGMVRPDFVLFLADANSNGKDARAAALALSSPPTPLLSE